VGALTPFSANALALMGVFPKAIGQTLGGDRRYVSGLSTTPRLALRHPLGPNMEVLQRRRPDLIFTSPEWRAGRDTMERIVSAKPNGRVVNADPTSVQEVFSKTRQIARIVNTEARGERLVRSMKSSMRRALRGIEGRPTVMVVLGVGTNNPLAFRPDSWGGEIVRMAGGRLRPGGLTGGGFADISNEQVVAENPDVIIAVPHGDESELTPEAKAAFVDQWPGITSRVVFSEDNSLLQAGTDIGRTITKVRAFLRN
jgi:iron complex transport system substrate-binding protein